MYKVSIVVPVYKVEKYLERCVYSIVNQSLKEIEIILIDDGSPDNCGSLCDHFALKDDRIKVIHKKNGGVSAARNDGMRIATGEYILFVDSDDWMELDACKILYSNAIDANADIVIADVKRITQCSTSLKRLYNEEFIYTEKKDIEQLIISTLYPPCCKIAYNKGTGYGGPWNKLIRTKLLNNADIKFNTNVGGICDDSIFVAESYAHAKKIVYIAKPVYNFVNNEGSLTKSYKPDILRLNYIMFESYSKIIDSFSINGNGTDVLITGRPEWGEMLYNAYLAFVIGRLVNAVKLYFFSTKNPQKLYEKIVELNRVINNEPYRTAAKNVSMSSLSKSTRLIVKCIRMKSASCLWFSYKMYIIYKNKIRHQKMY